MMPLCESPIPDTTLLDYWAGDLADGPGTDRVEEHLFACSECSARLRDLAALGPGLATLVRQGRDPQLEKAVEVLMESLKNSPLPRHEKPEYPNYHKAQ